MEDKNQKIRENRRSENKSSRLSLSSWFSNLHNNLMKHLGIKKEEVQQVKIPFIFRKKSPSIKAFEESARFSIAKIRAKDFTSYTPERLHQLLKPEMLVPKQLFKNPKVRKELQEQIEKDRKQFLEEWNKFYYLPDEDVQLFIQDLEKIREKTIREYKDKSKEREMSIKEEH